MKGVGEWAKLEDDKPELLNLECLIWPEQNFTYGSTHIATFEDGEFFISCEDSHSCWEEKAIGVTHWMYFPAGPKD